MAMCAFDAFLLSLHSKVSNCSSFSLRAKMRPISHLQMPLLRRMLPNVVTSEHGHLLVGSVQNKANHPVALRI